MIQGPQSLVTVASKCGVASWINFQNVAANVVVPPFSNEIKLWKSQGAQGRG